MYITIMEFLYYNAKKSGGGGGGGRVAWVLAPQLPPLSTLLGMIALELNSVTRIHNEISCEMPAAHHNPEFRFSILNRIMLLILRRLRASAERLR